MRYLHRSDEALLLGVVRTWCSCPKPTNDEEQLAFRCRCGAAAILEDSTAERLAARRAQLAETRRARGNLTGVPS